MKFQPKKLFYILIFPAFAGFLGCPGGETKRPGTGPREEEVTAQMVFDEAAKGVGKTDLKRLKTLYDKLVKDKAKADVLASTKDPSSDDRFLCKLLALPTVDETSKILSDLIGKVSDAVKVINEPCAGSKHPMDLLIETTRSVADDKTDDHQEMIKILVDKGNAATIGIASDAAKVTKVLDAVKAKGDQAQMKKAVADAAPAVKGEVLAWSITNLADAKVKTALEAIITGETVVDYAAKGAGANTGTLKTLYEMFRGSDPGTAPAKAASLANLPAAGTDKFSHFLAKLPADTNVREILTDYAANIEANTDAAAVTAQINLADGAGITPFGFVLATVPTDATERDRILTWMVFKGDQTTVRTANDRAKMEEIFNAIQAEGTKPILRMAFERLDDALNADLLAWVKTNSAKTIGTTGDTVQSALKDSEVPVDLNTLFAQIQTVTKDGIPYVEALYNRYFAGGGVRGIALNAAQKAAIVALEDKNTAGTYTGGDAGDGFIHFLVRLPAVVSRDTEAMLGHFITSAVAGMGALIPPVAANAAKATVIGRRDLNNHTALEILTPGTAGTVRAAGQLPDDDAATLADMQNLVR